MTSKCVILCIIYKLSIELLFWLCTFTLQSSQMKPSTGTPPSHMSSLVSVFNRL